MPIKSNAEDGMPSILPKPILEDARAKPSGSTAESIPTPGTSAAIVERSPDKGRAHIPQRILFCTVISPESIEETGFCLSSRHGLSVPMTHPMRSSSALGQHRHF